MKASEDIDMGMNEAAPGEVRTVSILAGLAVITVVLLVLGAMGIPAGYATWLENTGKTAGVLLGALALAVPLGFHFWREGTRLGLALGGCVLIGLAVLL